ncbi:potassium channel family protein [Alkalihalobacillus pseudalcaliphilus]|uniref:potassium channel family protein n=1 Tax=Alkalihalobacillus pseudalcaliphilus TaxID=79884 RepID=UPI00064DA1ED|nr:TrkA family potassium uptake protein [Alkalihalobacillus pseudalcaliphilus]KMK75145.1 potassium transporter Trk [Alkalihalobacillus pseudalcaliphilus]
MKKKQFLVIGLGRFGTSLTKTLIENKHEVLAIDRDMNLVEDMASIATQALQGDSTDEDVLNELQVQEFHHAIVAIGDNLQDSILTTLLLKEMGVPKITVKANSEIHGKVLTKIGADHVVYPERDMAIRLARQLSSDTLVDYIELSPDYNVFELTAHSSMRGKTISELNIRAKYGLTILAIKSGNSMNVSPKADNTIQDGDILLMLGSNQDIQHMEEKYGRKR